MKEKYTEIIFVLDRSGSMEPLTDSTISSYNEFLTMQAMRPDEKKVTTVLFDDQYEVLYRGLAPEQAKIDRSMYFARGMTALYDAIGKTIIDTAVRISGMAETDRPSKVILVIATDGEENSSREFTGESVRKMVEKQKSEHGWEVIFFGANIDAKQAAHTIGVSADRAVQFEATDRGVHKMMCMACGMVSDIIDED